ncbi:hypothetical protein SDRG_12126 [Saprolegnia diclina VS20]|uniref:RNA-dependent RNA polymerase n=1 Tax=Saprolegnia diclina (strain VS20) TaxID=1156394 RepID=T0Q6N8_SAPDV|nr:hypothetical protein SDRG_12126 [Saprolegnia diclina VS20]EQC30276.1 hypothetical protein SDRG_12126 [Saprolegnia diclina VS20]|eukprot:XP_008616408.1 hypothetical protein SDRG_12126 [Saprolegnia diclina VS20]
MLTVELIEAQARAREASRRAEDRANAYNNNFASIVSSTTSVVAATITNVPSDMTAADVAKFCRQCTNFYGGFLSVSMAPYTARRRGRSTVFMASRLFHALVLALDGIFWQGEAIRVREAAAVGRSVCTDVTSSVFYCKALCVLPTAASDQPSFDTVDVVTLTCSSMDATTFAIAFDGENDYRYRVCLQVTNVVRCRVGRDDDDRVVARFTLRTPPFVYIGDRRKTDEDRVWPIADAAYKWERSDDPSPNGAFGHCRCYHLVLESAASPDTVVPLLRSFGLADVTRQDRLPVFTSVASSSPPPTDWVYAPTSELHDVSFPLRYALHVLMSQEALVVTTTDDASNKAILSVADETLRDLAAPLKTHAKAIQFVKAYAPKATILKLLQAGVSVQDPFVADWLHMLRRHVFNNIKFRSRIRVLDGVVLMGVIDETNTLPEGCIFFLPSFRSPLYKAIPATIGTRCVVGRHPSLHPGDLRVLTYMMVPALCHLFDVLVFSSRGQRPVTDMMSGGDMDGDLYFCLWDQRLVPAQDVPPMQPPAASLGIPPPSSAPGIQGIQDHFIRFLAHDNLGMISNMHLAIADNSVHKAYDVRALELAEAHAIAVDFAKSGIEAPTPMYNIPAYPDFMERAGPSYKSKTAIGILYRKSRSVRRQPVSTEDVDWAVLTPGFDVYLADARHWFVQYAHALFTLCQQFGIQTEVELISGYIKKLSRTVGRAERLNAVERIRVALRLVQEHFARVFWRDLGSKTPSNVVVLQKASAWYYVGYTHHHEAPGLLPTRSFAWLALEPMLVLFRKIYEP